MYLKNPILKLVDEPYPPSFFFFVLCDFFAFGVYDLYTQFIASILDFFFFVCLRVLKFK